MKLVLHLAALLLSVAAHAGGPNCAPSLVGTTDTATHAVGDVDASMLLLPRRAWVGWWCSDGVTWHIRIWHVTAEALTPELRADLRRLIAGGVLDGEAIAEVARKHVTHTGALPAWVDRDALVAIRPLAPVWVVAKNGSSTTRPTYPVTAGVRSTVSTGRMNVTPTTICDCQYLTLVEGRSRYCSVGNGAVPLVALCTRGQ